MNRGMQLELSIQNDDFGDLGATYRDQDMSIGADHMRLFGETVNLEVDFRDLKIGSILGRGACSSVYAASHKRSGERYALKIFNVYDRGQASQLHNEILLLTSFQCDALISLKGAFHDHGSIGVILEFMDRGTIEFMKDPDLRVSDIAMAAMSFQVVWGLAFLHYERQLHRDIKPGNILMNSQGQVKLSDFGISKELDSTTALAVSCVGTNQYLSPERMEGERYDASADVWAAAISFIEIWMKRYPFTKLDSPIELCAEIQRYRYDDWMPAWIFPGIMRRCLEKMLQPRPEHRVTSFELTTDPWFVQYNIQSLDDAMFAVQSWLVELSSSARGQQSKHNSTASSRSSAQLARSMTAAAARDMCEMSMSMSRGASHNWGAGGVDLNEMSMSMTSSRVNNPFMSSGTLMHSINNNNNNAAPKEFTRHVSSTMMQEEEEYESDFDEEEAKPYDDFKNVESKRFRK